MKIAFFYNQANMPNSNHNNPLSTSKTSHILLVNLGSPKSPSIADVRSYLKEFLDDPRVIDLPTPLRKFILHAFILPFRPKKSAHAYQSIWTSQGSPLAVHTQSLTKSLKQYFTSHTNVQIHHSMRYGQPSIANVVQKMSLCDGDKLIILPLYPQYATSTTGSVLAEVYRILGSTWNIPSIQIKTVEPFYQHPQFINAIVSSIRPYIDVKTDAKPHLLFSFHGLPHRHLQKSQCAPHTCLHENFSCCESITTNNAMCYRAQCHATAKLVAKTLGLDDTQWTLAFQSRLGRATWIGPYTSELLKNLQTKDIKHLVVACPSFVSDCLETLEEIGLQGRKTFLAHGGNQFDLVPCLNDNNDWTTGLASILEDYLRA